MTEPPPGERTEEARDPVRGMRPGQQCAPGDGERSIDPMDAPGTVSHLPTPWEWPGTAPTRQRPRSPEGPCGNRYRTARLVSEAMDGIPAGSIDAVVTILRTDGGPIRRRKLLAALKARGHTISLAGLNRILEQCARDLLTAESPEGIRLRPPSAFDSTNSRTRE